MMKKQFEEELKQELIKRNLNAKILYVESFNNDSEFWVVYTFDKDYNGRLEYYKNAEDPWLTEPERDMITIDVKEAVQMIKEQYDSNFAVIH